MKRFLITLAMIALAICAIEASKALGSWRSALKEVDDLYVVKTNQDAVCLGASCIGCSIIGDRFKRLWVPSSFEGISVMAPLARLMELERRRQLKGVNCCIMESCLFSYASKYNSDSDNMLAAMWMQELPVNWRHRNLCPVKPKVYWVSLGRLFKMSALRKWDFGFKICGQVKDDRLPLLERDEKWRSERIEFYRKRDFDNYESKCNAVDVRIREIGLVDAVCKKLGLKLLVVFPPMSSFYIQSAPKEALDRKAEFKSSLEARGIMVFDRMQDYPDELFFDPTHLTRKGAVYFTKDITAFIDSNIRKR